MTDFSFVQVLNDLTSLQISWGIYLCSWLFIFSALTNDSMICRSKLWPINMPWNSINLFNVSFFVKCPELIHRARILQNNFISIIIHCEVATLGHARMWKGLRYASDSTSLLLTVYLALQTGAPELIDPSQFFGFV